MVETAKKVLTGDHQEKKEAVWMTNEMLQMMNERRKYRDRCNVEYKRADREIQRKFRDEK